MTYEAWRISYQSSEQAARAAYEECAQLRARIDEMEKQGPVAWMDDGTCRAGSEATANRVVTNETKRDMPASVAASFSAPLYLAPGAQPAPSVPEGWKLVPTAESRHPGIYKMLGALHTDDNTPGASEWESYAAFLAAAPEAKP